MMELLSPAGSLDKLRTALAYGADAAYMGLSDFSLRANAENISLEDKDEVNALKKAYGAKLYCALNIFFPQSEVESLDSYLEKVEGFDFDGFILSDPGIIKILRRHFPNAELHLSTQANCLNSYTAGFYHDIGFSRIIVSRECSLADIRRIKDLNPGLEVEAFIHGAMCMAYSGRCLLSKYLTGRSANQGDCAHTCRWDYRLALEESQRPGMYMPIAESDGYTSILSSKDLCMIDHLADLKAAGVDSLKIEGRMKSLYYVAVTTRAYRKALDSLERGDDDYLKYRDEIFNVSHREFSTGFFFDSEAISSAAQGSYIRNYRFLGLISKEVQPGIWSLDIRNQIQSGLTLEYIGPDEFCIQDSDYQTLNENLEPVSHIDHCQVCYLKTGKRVKEGYIIRVQA